MSAYSEWKAGIISDSEYGSICRMEEADDELDEFDRLEYSPISAEDALNMIPELLSWVWDHVSNEKEYVKALDRMGFDYSFIYTDLRDMDYNHDDAADIMRRVLE